MTYNFSIALEGKPLTASEKEEWEHMLKLRYFTADLYIADSKRLVSEEVLKHFDDSAVKDIGGEIAYVIVDAARILPNPDFNTRGQSWTWTIDRLSYNVPKDGEKFLLPLNFAPPPLHRYKLG